MNYRKIYEALIDRARNRIIQGYYETHHIIPKCMGGSNESSNLIDLTPEEHFLCHQLLVKIYKGTVHYQYMVYSVKMMTIPSNKNQQRDCSKLKMFGWLRREYSKTVSDARKGKPGNMLGKKSPWTSERNRKLKGTKRILTDEHRHNLITAISKPRSDDVKAKISATKTGVPRSTKECPHCRRHISDGNFSRWHGDNCKENANKVH